MRAYLLAQALAGAAWWIAVFQSDTVQRETLGGWEPGLLVVPDLLLFVGGSLWAAFSGSRLIAVVVAVWTVGITLALGVYGLVEQAAGWGVVAMASASIGSVTAALTLWFGRLPTEWFFHGPFSFRPAQAASRRSHVTRSLAQLVVFWTAFFLIVPAIVVVIERRLGLSAQWLGLPLWSAAGWLLLGAGSAVGIWSCLTMASLGEGTPLPGATARLLVVRGPYRFVRNPMAVAGAAQTVAVGMIVGSWIVIVMAIAGAVAWNLFIRPVEEADLAARFGDDYAFYRRSVRCWIPRLRVVSPDDVEGAERVRAVETSEP